MSVLEAMSIGLPLVLSDCVGNRDLVKNNGFLYSNRFEAVTYINELLKRNIFMLGINSRRLVSEEFSIENMKNSYLKIYRDNEEL